MFRLLWECDNCFIYRRSCSWWCAWPPLAKVLNLTLLPPAENQFLTAIFHSPVHPHPWTLDHSLQSFFRMPEQLGSKIIRWRHFHQWFKGFLSRHSSIYRLMNKPSLVFLGQTNRVYHIIWSSLVLWVGESPWMNSFQCKQKFKSYTYCSRRAIGSPEKFQVKSCYLKWAGYSEVGLIGKGGHSHPCGAQESYEDAQKRTTSLFNVLLNWGSFAVLSRHDRQQGFISCPRPLLSVDSLHPNS